MKQLQKLRQIFIRLHIYRCHRDRSHYIFPAIVDGVGEFSIIHGPSSK